jgi:large-conductance mechanosensitive channel
MLQGIQRIRSQGQSDRHGGCLCHGRGVRDTVVTAFIQGVFLPLLSPVMGGMDLPRHLPYDDGACQLVAEAGEVVNACSCCRENRNFISAIISFTIVAFVMFLIIKGMNKMKKKKKLPRRRLRRARKCFWKKSATCWQNSPARPCGHHVRVLLRFNNHNPEQ